MPYRYAHYYVLALFPAALLAFWFSFFSRIPDASAAVHIHSWSATLWVFLLAAQSWSIHNRRLVLHRTLGKLSLAVFPVFFAGFFLVIRSEAQTVLDGDPYRTVFAPGIGVLTLIAAAAIAYLYFSGLKHRRTVQLHARYMFAIPFLFTESVFGRIFNYLVPGLAVASTDDIRNIYWAIHLSQVLAISFAMLLYFQNRKHGAPFLFVSVALVLQSIGLEVFDSIGWWREIYLSTPSLPFMPLLGAGVLGGIIIAWRGWLAGASGTIEAHTPLTTGT